MEDWLKRYNEVSGMVAAILAGIAGALAMICGVYHAYVTYTSQQQQQQSAIVGTAPTATPSPSNVLEIPQVYKGDSHAQH
jgi:uncharacterized membrane protein